MPDEAPQQITVTNGRPDKILLDKLFDLLLFGLSGGLITTLAWMGSIQPEQCATLASVLVGAAAMYLKGK